MEQLPLDVGLADYAVFDSFLPAGNDEAVHALQALALDGLPPFVWIWGAPGTGRTHLLQATVNAAAEAGSRTAYLPLGTPDGIAPAAADGLGALDVVCLDDIGGVAGHRDWERGLFMLYEQLRAGGGRLAVAASHAPASGAFALLTQVVLLRELQVTSLGNDLVYIVGFGVWLFANGCGALIAQRLAARPERIRGA